MLNLMPDEELDLIFDYLPYTDLVSLRGVCWRLRQIVDKRVFVDSRLSRRAMILETNQRIIQSNGVGIRHLILLCDVENTSDIDLREFQGLVTLRLVNLPKSFDALTQSFYGPGEFVLLTLPPLTEKISLHRTTRKEVIFSLTDDKYPLGYQIWRETASFFLHDTHLPFGTRNTDCRLMNVRKSVQDLSKACLDEITSGGGRKVNIHRQDHDESVVSLTLGWVFLPQRYKHILISTENLVGCIATYLETNGYAFRPLENLRLYLDDLQSSRPGMFDIGRITKSINTERFILSIAHLPINLNAIFDEKVVSERLRFLYVIVYVEAEAVSLMETIETIQGPNSRLEHITLKLNRSCEEVSDLEDTIGKAIKVLLRWAPCLRSFHLDATKMLKHGDCPTDFFFSQLSGCWEGLVNVSPSVKTLLIETWFFEDERMRVCENLTGFIRFCGPERVIFVLHNHTFNTIDDLSADVAPSLTGIRLDFINTTHYNNNVSRRRIISLPSLERNIRLADEVSCLSPNQTFVLFSDRYLTKVRKQSEFIQGEIKMYFYTMTDLNDCWVPDDGAQPES